MKTTFCLSIVSLLLGVSNLSAATHYVSGSATPTPPYATWATAATNIQDAVNVAAAGDEVLVTNGTFAGGIIVSNPVALQSVNGPQFTLIDGGDATQCVSLTNGASLTGFTLTNGYADLGAGGGVWCSSTNAFVTNCVIVGNMAFYGIVSDGGGAYGGALYNCTLAGNSASYGSGAYGSFLYNCTLSNNVAPGSYSAIGGGISSAGEGGGAYGCTLQNCILIGNSAAPGFGGGAFSSVLYNCTLTSNSANGGLGADSCTLYNCAVNGNTAVSSTGAGIAAVSDCTLYNCTLTGNSGGGTNGCIFYNCIVYFNTAANGVNYNSACTLNYCCTTPLPTNGAGNFTLDPQLADAIYLGANSPCRGAGSAVYATGSDIEGDPWNNPPSIGCAEYDPAEMIGPLTVGLVAKYTNVAVGYPLSLTALIEGRVTESVWEFGDGEVATNEPFAVHRWTQPGNYLVALRAFNESNPQGVSSTVMIHVAEPLVYVAAASTNPQPPYASWATAATTIQDAVTAAGAGGKVTVSNGVYAGGINVTAPLTLTSVNGPEMTTIDGGGTNQCVSLTDGGASLAGFTLINGFSYGNGAGLYCSATNAFVTNCLIEYCSTYGNGGGAYQGTLYNCILFGNSAVSGCGAWGCTLYNCTLAENMLDMATLPVFVFPEGGGADNCILFNCNLSGNSTLGSGGGAAGCILYNCALTGNSASTGAGAFACTLGNCTLTGNSDGGAVAAILILTCGEAGGWDSGAANSGVRQVFTCL